jgi:hypothetical protein
MHQSRGAADASGVFNLAVAARAEFDHVANRDDGVEVVVLGGIGRPSGSSCPEFPDNWNVGHQGAAMRTV